MTDVWDPRQYERFARERRQPFDDLVALVHPLDRGGRVVDLGCGQGKLTAELADRLGATEVLGLDNSQAMLADSAAVASGRVRFGPADIGPWQDPGRWDVVLANASLQWVPDHTAVLARWTASLRPGGQLAVQVPANADHPSHLLIDEVARETPFVDAFPNGLPVDPVATNVLSPERYASRLDELGFPEQHVRLQVYGHHLTSSADVVEWDARPYFYLFKRILLWGRRPAR